MIASLPTHKKSYTQWTGHTVEGYCKFRATINECVKQAPLNNVNEWVTAVSLLLSGTPLSNWKNKSSKFPEDHV
jgi:hypothetical protein